MCHIKIIVRMSERFAFVTGDAIDESAKAVPENNKKSLYTLFLMEFFILTQCPKTQAPCQISYGFNYKFHSVQQSLNSNVTKERNA